MSDPIIKVEDVWFQYSPEVVALKDINLEINTGEILALIGQNGGGKTTLAKHFNGLLKPTKGRVLAAGMDTKETPTHMIVSKVGYVFQNPAHQIFMSTVYEEVAYGPRNLELSEEEVDKRVKEALRVVGLEGTEEMHPYDLDYGKRKLLTVASILSMDPEVFVLDEPTTGQDHVGRRVLSDLCIKLNKEGKTVVVITHDMRFVARTVKRVVLMADGRILKDGSVEDVLYDYETLRKAFIRPPQVVELNLRLGRFPERFLTVNEAAEVIRNVLKPR
ncbi:MAG TPA: ATP-binding cassette domain-containing protein [Candidatus Korarchaeota archaeon]|nr:ATP-binding cassette domain-containing protein [Candidatus Korarchaeota archaeon]